MFAEIDDAVSGNNAREMDDVPLEGDCRVLRGARDAMATSRVADNPEVDCLKRQGYQEGAPKPGGRERWNNGTRRRGTNFHIEKTDEGGWKLAGDNGEQGYESRFRLSHGLYCFDSGRYATCTQDDSHFCSSELVAVRGLLEERRMCFLGRLRPLPFIPR